VSKHVSPVRAFTLDLVMVFEKGEIFFRQSLADSFLFTEMAGIPEHLFKGEANG